MKNKILILWLIFSTYLLLSTVCFSQSCTTGVQKTRQQIRTMWQSSNVPQTSANCNTWYSFWNFADDGNPNNLFWKLNGNTAGSIKFIGTIDNFDLPFRTNNTEKMRLTSGGNLGIGSILPSAKVHIKGVNSGNDSYSLKVDDGNDATLFHVRNDNRIISSNIGTVTNADFKIYRGEVVTADFRSNLVFIGNFDSGDLIDLTCGKFICRTTSDDGSLFAFKSRDGNGKDMLLVRSDSKVAIKGGTVNPVYDASLEVIGIGNNDLTYSVKVKDSGLNNLFSVRNDGEINLKDSISTTEGDGAIMNVSAGRFRKDVSGTTFTLTNSLIDANSIIILTCASNLTQGYNISVVAGAGSAVITFYSTSLVSSEAVPTAPTSNQDINFLIIN